jgi:heat shock protein HslJ
MRNAVVGTFFLIGIVVGCAPVGAQSGKGSTPRIGDELEGTSWQAEAIDGKPVPDPAAMTIDFLKGGDQVRGQAGCNRFVGPFASRGDKVSLGILRQSRSDCPPEQAAMQQAFIDMLHAAWRTELNGRTLTFYGRQGQQITLTPRPR